MKGVILAGGMGVRLHPLTLITNKHLLPVYNKPMIYYPIECLVKSGIDEIMLVTGGEHAGDFLKLLQNGQDLGIRKLSYAYQKGHGGIAEALKYAEDFCDGESVCVVLGDNIVQYRLDNNLVHDFQGAHLFLKEVPDPERFGVAEIQEGKVTSIVEKPKKPLSHYAVTGIYMYDCTVFDKCKNLVPSDRGELEISDVNNAYLKEGNLQYSILDGWWSDAGTFESLWKASSLVREYGANNDL